MKDTTAKHEFPEIPPAKQPSSNKVGDLTELVEACQIFGHV